MPTITDVLNNNIIHAKRQIHDAVDTGADLTLLSGVTIPYPVDAAGREYKSGDVIWDKLTSEFTDSILDSVIMVKWDFVLNCSQISKILHMAIVIPDPGGDIPVYDRDYDIGSQNNTDLRFSNSTVLYNAAEALASGFRIDITPDNDMTLKARSVMLTIS